MYTVLILPFSTPAITETSEVYFKDEERPVPWSPCSILKAKLVKYGPQKRARVRWNTGCISMLKRLKSVLQTSAGSQVSGILAQGLILVPIICNIFINNLNNEMEGTLNKFAADTGRDWLRGWKAELLFIPASTG